LGVLFIWPDRGEAYGSEWEVRVVAHCVFAGKRISREAPGKGYLPFGFGTRSCIGATLALIEGTVMVALLAQRFTFHEVRLETSSLL
jgi:hypothetical protein